MEVVQASKLLIQEKPCRMKGFAYPSLVRGESLPGMYANMHIEQVLLHEYFRKSDRYQGTERKPKISNPTNQNNDSSPLI